MRPQSQAGTSLVELLVVMAILSVVLGIVFAGLVSIQNTANRVSSRKQSEDQVRLAVEQIDRQLRSGNYLYDPANEGTSAGSGISAGFSMRVYTQANGVQKCVQWRVTGGKLQSRSWTPSWQVDGQVSGWRTVAENIVNSTSTPPFSLDSNANFNGQLINVDIIANVRSDTGANVESKASIEGRNKQFGYGDVCTNPMPTP